MHIIYMLYMNMYIMANGVNLFLTKSKKYIIYDFIIKKTQNELKFLYDDVATYFTSY
jgi:hypothetical protein